MPDLFLIANAMTLRVANGRLPLKPLGVNSIGIKQGIDIYR